MENQGVRATQENDKGRSLTPGVGGWGRSCSFSARGVGPVGGQDAEASGWTIGATARLPEQEEACPYACRPHPPVT